MGSYFRSSTALPGADASALLRVDRSGRVQFRQGHKSGLLHGVLSHARSCMKILISVDMEGISGVATRRETATGWPPGAAKGNDYERARAWMTGDANAAIAGAFEGGATEIVVA